MSEIMPADSHKAIEKACRLVNEGEIIAFPTDTLYGVGANAFDPVAIEQIFAIKKRPRNKALPLFISQIDDLKLVAQNLPDNAWPLLRRFWPGALTVILPKNPAVPDELTAGGSTVAVRIPDHSVCLELIIRTGHPLAVTSANLSGQPTPSTAQGVEQQFGNYLLLILDGGVSPSVQPSTIVDLSISPPRLLRMGVLSVSSLREFLPGLLV